MTTKNKIVFNPDAMALANPELTEIMNTAIKIMIKEHFGNWESSMKKYYPINKAKPMADEIKYYMYQKEQKTKFTPDDVYLLLGLEDHRWYRQKITQDRKDAECTQDWIDAQRYTGRTTRMLALAVANILNGEKVRVYSYSYVYSQELCRTIEQWISRIEDVLDIKVEYAHFKPAHPDEIETDIDPEWNRVFDHTWYEVTPGYSSFHHK